MPDLKFIPGLGYAHVPGPIDKSFSAAPKVSEAERAAGGAAPEGQVFYQEGMLLVKHEMVGEGGAHEHAQLKEEPIETGLPSEDPVDADYKPEEAVMPSGKQAKKPKVAEETGDAEAVEEDVEAEEENYDEEPEDKSLPLTLGQVVYVPRLEMAGRVVSLEPDGSLVVKSEGRLHVLRAEDLMPK